MLAVSFFRVHEGKSKGLQGFKFSQPLRKPVLHGLVSLI